MGFPDGHYLADEYLGPSPEDVQVTEVRLAVQKATGWGGDDALKLMRKYPQEFSSLINFSRTNPSPERIAGQSWARYG